MWNVSGRSAGRPWPVAQAPPSAAGTWANGRALYVNQAGNIQRQLIVNGEVLGIYGAGVNPSNPASGYENNPNFANVVDFDFGYAKISANYPTPSPGAYTVRVGDTLQSIAQGAYGDSSLWYRIAEANGLASSSELKVGQTLNIPNRVSTINNNAGTFKPYDPSEIEGDKTPSLATPRPKKGNFFKQLLMVIIIVVATIFTAGALSVGLGSSLSTIMSAGASVMTGGAVGTTLAACVAPTAIGSALGTAGVAVLAGAVGTIAGQAFALGTGMQDKFDWRAVGVSALTAGVGAGIGSLASAPGGAFADMNSITRAAMTSVASQGVAVATGLQQKFSWAGVAASAVGAGVGQVAGEAFGLNASGFKDLSFGEQFGRRLATGLVAGAATAVARGGKVAVQQVAVDAFGNALGSSLASSSTSAPAMQGDPLGEFIQQNMPRWEQRQASYDAIIEAFTDTGAIDRSDDEQVADALRLSNTRSDAQAENNVFNTIMARKQASSQAILDRLNAINKEATALVGSSSGAGGGTSDGFRAEEARATAALIASGAGAVRQTSGLEAPSVPGIGSGYFDADGEASPVPVIVAATPETGSQEQEIFRRSEINAMNKAQRPAEMTALPATFWQSLWFAPEVRQAMHNTITGKLISSAVNTAGSVAASVRSDRYNFATGKTLNPVEQRNARIDNFIGLATLPIGLGSTTASRLELQGGKAVWQQSVGAERQVYETFSKNYASGKYRDLDLTIRERGLLAQERRLAETADWKRPDGTTWYPPYDGGLPGTQSIISLEPGSSGALNLVDRFGKTTGKYVSPAGASYESRALNAAPKANPSVYSVDAVIDGVERATIAPWFGKKGLGIQYKLPNSVQYYLDTSKLGAPK